MTILERESPLNGFEENLEEQEKKLEEMKKQKEDERKMRIRKLQEDIKQISTDSTCCFDSLLELLKTLHSINGDVAVARYLKIFGKVCELNEAIRELDEIQVCLCNCDYWFDYECNPEFRRETARLDKRHKKLIKERDELVASVGLQEGLMFSYGKKDTRYRY